MKKKSLLFTLLIIFFVINGFAQGLLFNSNENLIDERTSYDVFSEIQPRFEDFFSIEFDFSVVDKNSFGYILSVGDRKSSILYTLVYVRNDQKSSELRLNLEGEENILSIPIAEKQLGRKTNNTIKLAFNSVINSIEIDFNGNKYIHGENLFARNIKPSLIFGKNNRLIDVPEISIRNLRIKDDNQLFQFEFKESEGNNIYDTRGKKYGRVNNPNWLINDSYHWKLRCQFDYENVAAVTFAPQKQSFFISNSDSLVSYNWNNEDLLVSHFKNKLNVPLRLGMSFIDETQNRLYVYELNDVLENGTTIASLHLDSMTWANHSNYQFEQQRHHHNSVLRDNKFLVFGGFGNKRLSNSFDEYDLDLNKWQHLSFSGDVICPRFFSAISLMNSNELILFGGVGNKTGDQSLGKTYYSDCYKINFKDSVVEKLWSVKSSQDQVSARNLVFSGVDSSFYALSYKEYVPNTYLQLVKYDLKSGAHKAYGDSIPMISERIRTNANLYLSEETNELFCVVQEFKLNGANRIKIYSINYPPVSIDDIRISKDKFGLMRNILLIILVVIILLIIGLFYSKKRKLKTINCKKEVNKLKHNSLDDSYEHQKENCVYLFGNLKVVDRNGTNISHLFSPKLTQLFIAIITSSIYNEEKGISSEEIYDVVWPEKDQKKAKNLKNVSINQLRKILQDVDGVQLVFEDKLFRIKLEDKLFCDALQLSDYLDKLKNEETIDEAIYGLMSILKKGRFLRSVDLEYFDEVKRKFESKIFNYLTNSIVDSFQSGTYSRVVALSDILFKVDSVNEFALFYKIHALNKLGLLDESKRTYNSYVVEFKNTFNEDFNKTFREISKSFPPTQIQ